MGENEAVKFDNIPNKIHTIRGTQVMLDSDLAELYGVETKRLNEQVKRNIERFPEDFSFVLSGTEHAFLRSQNATLEKGIGKHKKYLPRVFSEHGVAMLSNVLKSKSAITMSIKIIKTFVAMRHFISENSEIFQRLNILEKRQINDKLETDRNFEVIFNAIENNRISAKQRIFFDGQIFDAHQFVSDLVRSAENSIILIDNFVDDTVLTLFSKRNPGVSLKILTKTVSKQLLLDMKKFNEQFPVAEIQEFSDSHDRFMIIDGTKIYHFGASLKDLGKKWFAFSKMDIEIADVLKKIQSYQ